MAMVIIHPFRWKPSDPLSREHALLEEVISDAVTNSSLPSSDIDLDRTEAGRTIRSSDPKLAAQIFLALVIRADYLHRINDLDLDSKPQPDDTLDRANQRALESSN